MRTLEIPSIGSAGGSLLEGWAKGREYDRVYIDADIAASLSRPEALLAGVVGDEANIAYFGFTRAIRELHLPPDFKTILTTNWQTGISAMTR